MKKVDESGKLMLRNGSDLQISFFLVKMESGRVVFYYNGRRCSQTLSVEELLSNGMYAKSVDIEGYHISVQAIDRNRMLIVNVSN